MRLELEHKVNIRFSVMSLASVAILFFTFFMMASRFLTPTGIPVDLPQSDHGTVEMQKVAITIMRGPQYFIGTKRVTAGTLEGELKRRLGTPGGSVILHVDKNVASQHLVYVAGIAASLEAKVVIATKAE